MDIEDWFHFVIFIVPPFLVALWLDSMFLFSAATFGTVALLFTTIWLAGLGAVTGITAVIPLIKFPWMFITGPAFVLMLCGSIFGWISGPQQSEFILNNESDFEICEVYLRDIQSDDWGSNRLRDGTTILARQKASATQIAEGQYDLLIEFCEDDVEPLVEYRFEVIGESHEFSLMGGGAMVLLYTENNGVENPYCDVFAPVDKSYGNYTYRFDIWGNSDCPNDDARSMTIHNAEENLKIWLYDSPECDLSDSATVITLKENVAYKEIGSFESSWSDREVDVKVVEGGNLDGKVSCIILGYDF